MAAAVRIPFVSPSTTRRSDMILRPVNNARYLVERPLDPVAIPNDGDVLTWTASTLDLGEG